MADFRHRLVGALLTDEVAAPAPTRETDLEGIQLYIGVRYLLLAPLYGYSLRQLTVTDQSGELTLIHDGIEEKHDLDTFRMRVRAHVRDELDRVASGNRGAIDLGRVADAEAASLQGQDAKVLSLLGAWPAPLAIFLRTPEGQMLSPEPRALIAKGLGLLGTACVRLGDIGQGEEIFRLGIQYAQDGVAAADIFQRLGEALMNDQRAAEAIGPLRRAIALGGDPKVLWPMLSRAFCQRGRYVAAFASVRAALAAGAQETDLAEDIRQLEGALGPKLTAWRAMVAASRPLVADPCSPESTPKRGGRPAVERGCEFSPGPHLDGGVQRSTRVGRAALRSRAQIDRQGRSPRSQGEVRAFGHLHPARLRYDRSPPWCPRTSLSFCSSSPAVF